MSDAILRTAIEHHRAGRMAEAEMLYRQLLAADPNHVDALRMLGVVARQYRCYDDAITLMSRAAQLDPNGPRGQETFYQLGVTFQEVRDLQAAEAAYSRAIELRGDDVMSLTNLGSVLKDLGRVDDAIAVTRRALAADPQPLIWDNLLLFLNYSPSFTAAQLAEEHRRWEEQCVTPRVKRITLPAIDRSPDRRLRIGYVADFRRHPTTDALLPILAAHDRSSFELFAYGDAAQADDATERVARTVDQFRDISHLSNEQAAQQIVNDRIDILIDAVGHSATGRYHSRLLLFAAKPAPVQVSYGAYPASSGLSAIDHRITDRFLDPLDQAPPGPEKLMRIDSFWCYPRDDDDVTVAEPPAVRNGYVTFGSLNVPMKVSPGVIELWSRVLSRVPGSKLRLLSRDRSDKTAPWIEQFAHHGIAADRLEWTGRIKRRLYLEQYGGIDIALDPFPWGGHMTGCDALWMGVPMVTLAGTTSVGRAGVSLLSNLNLAELIAANQEQYVEIASHLAADLPRLRELRSSLRPRMKGSIICDAAALTRQMDACLRAMWQTNCQSGG